MLTVTSRADDSNTGRVRWNCVCDCGNTAVVFTNNLTRGNTSSCGCIKKATDITGQKFGHLTVISRVGSDSARNSLWNCRCDCGNDIAVTKRNLTSGIVKSCGCMRKFRLTGYSDTRLYQIWYSMNVRTGNTASKVNDRHAKDYLDRGISICFDWNCQNNDGFTNFMEWSLNNGYEENLTIDRINNDDGYYPDNCRWADLKTQANNRRSNIIISINDETKTLTQWCESLGISLSKVKYRIQQGQTLEEALTQ